MNTPSKKGSNFRVPEWMKIKALPADRLRSLGWQAIGVSILALLMLFGVAKDPQPQPVPALGPKEEDGATRKATGDLEKAIAEQEAKVKELRIVLVNWARKFSNDPFDAMKELEERKLELEDQIHSLRELKGDPLYDYASKLEIPDNICRTLYPEYQAAVRRLKPEQEKGLGVNHPKVEAASLDLEAMRIELEKGVADLREVIELQLQMVYNRLERVGAAQKGAQNRIDFPGPVALPDDEEARRAYADAVETLRQLKLKLEAEANE